MEVSLFLLVGLFAGVLGAVLGIGGGLLLVPGLTLLMGLPVTEAVAISLVAVVANSTTVISRRVDKNLINVPLAIFIEPLCFLMGFVGGNIASYIQGQLIQMAFSIFCLLIIFLMLFKKENKKISMTQESSYFTMVFQESENGNEVVVTPRKPILLVGLTSASGLLSGILGIGGGALVVPSLNIIGGLPLKIATGTSSYIIGMSALGGVVAYLIEGKLEYIKAVPVLLGVILGARGVEAYFHRVSNNTIKVLFNIVLLVIAWRMWPK